LWVRPGAYPRVEHLNVAKVKKLCFFTITFNIQKV
jgi:hypothetical protein